MNKTIQIWLATNKNGKPSMHLEEPTKNMKTGKWESSKRYCNSVLYNQFEILIKNANMSWESSPEVFEIGLS